MIPRSIRIAMMAAALVAGAAGLALAQGASGSPGGKGDGGPIGFRGFDSNASSNDAASMFQQRRAWRRNEFVPQRHRAFQ